MVRTPKNGTPHKKIHGTQLVIALLFVGQPSKNGALSGQHTCFPVHTVLHVAQSGQYHCCWGSTINPVDSFQKAHLFLEEQ